jgi:hypothetical protein
MTPTLRDTMKNFAVGGESLNEPLDSLTIELRRISAEIQSIDSGFQAQMQEVLAQSQRVLEQQFQEKLELSVREARDQLRAEIEGEMRKDFEAELEARIARGGEVQKEIDRVAALIEETTKEIARMLDDPSIELSKVMRKRTEQAEMKAYLTGLRFSVADPEKSK